MKLVAQLLKIKIFYNNLKSQWGNIKKQQETTAISYKIRKNVYWTIVYASNLW